MTYESRGINNPKAKGALDSKIRVQHTASRAFATRLAHSSGNADVVDCYSIGSCVRLELSVGLGAGKVAELACDPVLPGGRRDEAAHRLQGLTHDRDIEIGVEQASINERRVEGVGRRKRDGSTYKRN